MPELPEVQTVVNTLAPGIVGRMITGVSLLRADVVRSPAPDLPDRLLGRSIFEVFRRGKKIVVRLDDDTAVCIHLGMTGRLTLESPDAPLQPHTHLTITVGRTSPARCAVDNAHRCQLRFRDPRRFGGIWCLNRYDEAAGNLGPEPLDMSCGQLAARLARTTRAVKTALLDQKLVAGLGNIYVDEVLHDARLHPLIPAGRLTGQQVRRLTGSIKRILHRAIAAGGSSFRDYVDADGRKGAFQELHRVYARAGLPCRRCRIPIQRIVVGGRSTHFCPNCQRYE